MHEAPIERRTHFVAKHTVLVRLASRVEARMEIERGFRDVVDANRLRQKAIHGAPEILHRDRIFDAHRRDLRQRMHACVRPPRARYLHRPAFDGADYFFENALNCRQTGLYLPAVEIRAVISDLKPQSPHNEDTQVGQVLDLRRPLRPPRLSANPASPAAIPPGTKDTPLADRPLPRAFQAPRAALPRPPARRSGR